MFATGLKDFVISYLHIKGFGGLRRAKKDSINLGCQTPRFLGYVDYMQTDKFETNLLRLIETAKQTHTALMCAEAVPGGVIDLSSSMPRASTASSSSTS